VFGFTATSLGRCLGLCVFEFSQPLDCVQSTPVLLSRVSPSSVTSHALAYSYVPESVISLVLIFVCYVNFGSALV
jgi:hypothetical protein